MIITGVTIAGSSMAVLLKNKRLFEVIGIKNFLIPAACLLVMYLIGGNGTTAMVALMLEACPCAAITTMFSIEFGHDENLASGSVVFHDTSFYNNIAIICTYINKYYKIGIIATYLNIIIKWHMLPPLTNK